MLSCTGYQEYICIFVMWYNGKYNDDYEKMQFYYYPDHLGSSSYITNLDGEVLQHIEYVPYGEVFIDELELTRKSAPSGESQLQQHMEYALSIQRLCQRGQRQAYLHYAECSQS